MAVELVEHFALSASHTVKGLGRCSKVHGHTWLVTVKVRHTPWLDHKAIADAVRPTLKMLHGGCVNHVPGCELGHTEAIAETLGRACVAAGLALKHVKVVELSASPEDFRLVKHVKIWRPDRSA